MWQYYSGKIKDTIVTKENLNRLHIILDKKEAESKIKSQQTQQLKQCEKAFRELSTSRIRQ